MPNVVKGSKQEKMVVVPYRPLQRIFFTLAILIGVAASAIGGFFYGYYQTMLTQETVQLSQEEFNREVTGLRSENSELSRQVTILDRSSVVDQRATEEVQSTIKGLRDRVAQLEQDVFYYRQVVAEKTEDTGLIVGQMDINGMRELNRFRYKIVMRQQDADGDTFLTGHVNVNLVGKQGEEQVILALRDISDEQDRLDIRLSFKYFQNIEGELVFPAGFEPERVQIAAVETAPIEKNIDQAFSWVVQGE